MRVCKHMVTSCSRERPKQIHPMVVLHAWGSSAGVTRSYGTARFGPVLVLVSCFLRVGISRPVSLLRCSSAWIIRIWRASLSGGSPGCLPCPSLCPRPIWWRVTGHPWWCCHTQEGLVRTSGESAWITACRWSSDQGGLSAWCCPKWRTPCPTNPHKQNLNAVAIPTVNC